MGPRGGLSCDFCRLNVGPCDESEVPEAVAAMAPASTAAEPAKLDLGATEVHPHSNPKIPKGSDEDLQEPAHGGVENMKSELVWLSFPSAGPQKYGDGPKFGMQEIKECACEVPGRALLRTRL
ncbi:uncharacterized protein C22orf42-like isoform X2 [Trachypithecus francoisi]|uniref:uncharacterized protein C22orf42-like isoform X2 n=1 Tax=Trachypithecus francoisi TaxID=54180 RepID=UPI00141AAAB3|nr:uncharacterized protein C22orf42-like isoform X2 [Trachypithecus francoisi]